MINRALFFLSTLALGQAALAQADRLECEAFQQRIGKGGAQLVDVRTPEEFAKDHIAGAVNIDWLGEDFMKAASKLDKSKPVLLYCAAGGRSEEAVATMRAAGFTDVVDLKFGLSAWKRANLPVTTR